MPETLQLSQPPCSEISQLVKQVAVARRVVVVTGAGVSVNCGIPDFRSSAGLFRQIQDSHGNLITKGRDLFDASVVFNSANTADIFYKWMTHLRHQCARAQPGVAHRFIRRLADREQLVRSYTQNIDGLERKAGLAVWDPYRKKDDPAHVPWKDTHSVPLHGTMEYLTCNLCSSHYQFPESSPPLSKKKKKKTPGGVLQAGVVCPDCQLRSEIRVADGRRPLTSGKLRPTVVLYEEPHPHCEEIAKIMAHDARQLRTKQRQTDSAFDNVVLVFGTTLKVPGCRQLIRQLATASSSTTTTILVNKEPVCGKSWNGVVDYQIVGDVDDWCRLIERRWNAQTKITQWTKKRKSACYEATECDKENVDSNAKKQQKAERPVVIERFGYSDPPPPVTRRSLRIALKQSA